MAANPKPRKTAKSTKSPLRVSCLGPAGTFTEAALHSQRDLANSKVVLYGSISEVLAAVESGRAKMGFAAIENSIEGSVNVTLDTLAFESDLLIQREVVAPVELHLFRAGAKGGKSGKSPSLAGIKTVISFPHALGQCRKWLNKRLPKAEVHASDSTSHAIRHVAETKDPSLAAIGTLRAGKIYGLKPLVSNIEDHKGNETRFVLVAKNMIPRRTGHDKTSVVIFQRKDRPGSLVSFLQEFAARSINMTDLESRPTKSSLGEYCFVIDFEGHIKDDLVADCLLNIMAKHADVKFLGSYPQGGRKAGSTRQEKATEWMKAEGWMRQLHRKIK